MAIVDGPADRKSRRGRRRLLIGLAGASVVVAGAIVAPVAFGASSTPSCSVDYSVTNSWPGGFQASVVVTNGSAAVTSWTLGFMFPGSQQVSSGWDGTWTQSGQNVSVASESWNGSLATGASVTLGFTGTFSGTNTDPTAFTFNGSACNNGSGTTPPPTTTTTAPPPSTTTAPPPTTTTTAAPTTTTAPPTTTTSGGGGGTSAAPQLHVSGNKLVDSAGNTVVLHGVDRSGGEFSCVQGNGIWDGPMDQTSVSAIKSWGVTAVRVPLNEACWNAESYVDAQYAGTNYQQAVEQYVNLLNSNGIVAILDLHWTDGAYTGNSSSCSSAQATCQKPMPDAAEAVPFWSSVASAFKGNNAVIFDLFNEPYPSRATGSETSGWQCWLNGGTCSGISYQVAGMQQLVNAVRSAGASNVLMLGGIEYSNDLTDWLQYEPTDPDHNLVASWHSYNFNTCASESCWTSQVAPVAASVPVIAGEIGENDCAGSYINSLMPWLDSEGISYLGWTWNTWDCSSGPALISDYNGTPTAFGSAFQQHLLSLPH